MCIVNMRTTKPRTLSRHERKLLKNVEWYRKNRACVHHPKRKLPRLIKEEVRIWLDECDAFIDNLIKGVRDYGKERRASGNAGSIVP